MKAWNTVESKDDGVDAVATSEIPLFGGLCIIQAKRYSRAVGLDDVKALAATMEDKHATKGVMVTTSWQRVGHLRRSRLRQEARSHRDLRMPSWSSSVISGALSPTFTIPPTLSAPTRPTRRWSGRATRATQGVGCS
jgi:hypothetical protein